VELGSLALSLLVERLKVLRHLGVAALLCVALSGCAKMSNLLDGDSNTSTSAATVTTDSQGNALSPEMIAANQTDPVATLYNRGLADLQSGSYNAAAKNFSEVERQYPYSKWATKAIVMQAYAFYQRNSYDDSINAANRYITLHPAGKDAPYAYYLVALSNYEQIKDVQRDQSRTRKALESLEEVQRRFPESPYAVDAGQRAQLARDHLAAKEMDVGRYYLKNGSILPASTVSRPWSPITRPPPKCRRRSIAWLKATWRLASPRKLKRPPPCWGTISLTASGTRTPIRWSPATARRHSKTRRAGSAAPSARSIRWNRCRAFYFTLILALFRVDCGHADRTFHPRHCADREARHQP
jgi:outer membrane assembly lipoprotein YfiO